MRIFFTTIVLPVIQKHYLQTLALISKLKLMIYTIYWCLHLYHKDGDINRTVSNIYNDKPHPRNSESGR